MIFKIQYSTHSSIGVNATRTEKTALKYVKFYLMHKESAKYVSSQNKTDYTSLINKLRKENSQIIIIELTNMQ